MAARGTVTKLTKSAARRGGAVILQRVERWPTLLIEGDDLAIDHRVVRQLPERRHDGRIPFAEIVVVSRPQADVAIPLEPDGPIPVELPLVQPLLTRRKRIAPQQQHRLAETGRRRRR